MLSYFTTRRRRSQTATELYGRLVAQAREPWFYSVGGVPDTPEGRLELIVLHLVLVMRRLVGEGRPGHALARATAEAFVTDIDDSLREMGIGDMTVPRKIKKTGAALYDRNARYREALAAANDDDLAIAIAEHVLERPAGEADMAAELAAYVRRLDAHLHACEGGALMTGQISFPSPNLLSGDDDHERGA